MLPDCVYIGLGGNLPGTNTAIKKALDELCIFLEFRSVSSLYLTEPQGLVRQDSFLNCVASFEIRPNTSPPETLSFLLNTEKKIGRVRDGSVPNGPRLIDLDLLLVGTTCYDDKYLRLPHARMHERRFVLEPLLEIAPDLQDPRNGKAYAKSLVRCKLQGIYSRTTLGYTSPSI